MVCWSAASPRRGLRGHDDGASVVVAPPELTGSGPCVRSPLAEEEQLDGRRTVPGGSSTSSAAAAVAARHRRPVHGDPGPLRRVRRVALHCRDGGVRKRRRVEGLLAELCHGCVDRTEQSQDLPNALADEEREEGPLARLVHNHRAAVLEREWEGAGGARPCDVPREAGEEGLDLVLPKRTRAGEGHVHGEGPTAAATAAAAAAAPDEGEEGGAHPVCGQADVLEKVRVGGGRDCEGRGGGEGERDEERDVCVDDDGPQESLPVGAPSRYTSVGQSPATGRKSMPANGVAERREGVVVVLLLCAALCGTVDDAAAATGRAGASAASDPSLS
jgi:hypothetical protein